MTATRTHPDSLKLGTQVEESDAPQRSVSLSSVLHWLVSRRVAMWLMIATIAAISLQLLVPQHRNSLPGEYEAWNARYGELSNVLVLAGVDRITSTPWFRTIVMLMSASMLLSAVLRGWSLARRGPIARGPVRHKQSAPTSTEVAAIVDRLRQSHFRVSYSEGEITASRGVLASWGSIASHLGIVIIVAGSVVSSLIAFTGYVELAPGQALLSGNQASGGAGYLVTNSRSEPEMAIRLDDIEVEKWPNGETKQVRVMVTIQKPDGTERSQSVTRNNPFSIGGTDVTLGSPMGPAVRFNFVNQNGDTSRGYINLPEDHTNTVPSVVRVPGKPFEITVRHALESEPNVVVRVEYTDDSGIGHTLQQGQSVAVAGGQLVFEDVETWALFMVSKDPGFSVMVAGGIIAIVGLALALFTSPVTLTARKEANTVVVEQRSRRFVSNLTSMAFKPSAIEATARDD